MAILLRPRGSRTTKAKTSTRQSTKSVPPQLLDPIRFVDHPAFRRKSAETILRGLEPTSPATPAASHNDAGITFVAGFVSQPLLTPAEEQSLFAGMNYFRFRAEQQRRRALASRSPGRHLAAISRDLQQATELRNRIVAGNLRLVVALAKKLSTSLDQMSELISEGVLPLIRAVELFDISLGNRFSTYATWAVRNQMVRVLQRSRNSVRLAMSGDILPETLPAPNHRSDESAASEISAQRVKTMLSTLPDRERQVVQARFGLDGEPAGQSLADIAAKVGLSKERVRQLVLKSLQLLRTQIPVDERRTVSV